MILFSALLLLPPASAAENVSVKRRELMEIQRQLEIKKREIDGFRRQESELRDDVSRLRSATGESRRKLAVIEDRIRESEGKKAALRRRLGALQLAEGQWRGVLAEELRGYQRLGSEDVDYFGREKVWEESFRRAAIVEKLEYLEGMRGFRRKTEAAVDEARRTAAALEARSQGARAEHRSREQVYQRAQAVYREAQGKLEQMQRAIRELQDSAGALTRLLRSLETKAPYRIPGERIPLAEPEHSLPWPLEGKVVSFFGREPVPALGTYLIRQGIRISAAARAEVHPVKTGKVLFAGPFRSYGKVLIVDHGQDFYTIYGELGEVLKAKGDEVRPTQAMARAGDAAPSGGVLYFEVRQSGEALDPLRWLEKR